MVLVFLVHENEIRKCRRIYFFRIILYSLRMENNIILPRRKVRTYPQYIFSDLSNVVVSFFIYQVLKDFCRRGFISAYAYIFTRPTFSVFLVSKKNVFSKRRCPKNEKCKR